MVHDIVGGGFGCGVWVLVHDGTEDGNEDEPIRRRMAHTVGTLDSMSGTYITPEFNAPSFTCPRCETVATQVFNPLAVNGSNTNAYVSRCFHCGRASIWEPTGDDWILVYPDKSPAPSPNEDLPDDVRQDYDEAAAILNRSPRGAAALLRLGVQRLCKHFGQPGRNINDDIAALVREGLSPLIQKAMDTVRITGNEAVHPGEINLDDDRDLALALFDFVNLIAEHMITTPKRIDEMYERLPESKRQQVAQRDGDRD